LHSQASFHEKLRQFHLKAGNKKGRHKRPFSIVVNARYGEFDGND